MQGQLLHEATIVALYCGVKIEMEQNAS